MDLFSGRLNLFRQTEPSQRTEGFLFSKICQHNSHQVDKKPLLALTLVKNTPNQAVAVEWALPERLSVKFGTFSLLTNQGWRRSWMWWLFVRMPTASTGKVIDTNSLTSFYRQYYLRMEKNTLENRPGTSCCTCDKGVRCKISAGSYTKFNSAQLKGVTLKSAHNHEGV